VAVFTRLWAVAVGVLAIVIAAFVLLAILNFKQIQTRLLLERLVVLAELTADPFEAAARLGLPLANVRNSAALLERARQSDDAIQGIYVLDKNSELVHSTNGTLSGDLSTYRVPASDITRWSWVGGDHLFSAVRIVGSVGQFAGAVVVEIDTTASAIRTRAMAAELLTSALAIWALMTTLSGAALWVWLRPQIEGFRSVEAQIEQFESDVWSGHFERSPVEPDATLGLALRETYQNYQKSSPAAGRRDV